MRRLLGVAGLAATLVLSYPAAAAAAPGQSLPPGAIKHPGEKCATRIQPPENEGCPGPPNDIVADGSSTGYHWCRGSAYQVGDCRAAEHGFFDSLHFAGRNGVERCIISRENGGSYGRSPNPGHFGRYQFSPTLWPHFGGIGPWGYASPAEQDWVFVTAMDAGGAGNWRPYDHC